MYILTEKEKKQMKERILIATTIAGSTFLFLRFKKGDDYIIECKEVGADSTMYFCKGEDIFNAYKKQLLSEFRISINRLKKEGWKPI
jgi:hypothetical protein